MKLYLKFDTNIAFKQIMQEQLNKLQIPYTYVGFAEIEINGNVSSEGMTELSANLNKYGVEVVET